MEQNVKNRWLLSKVKIYDTIKFFLLSLRLSFCTSIAIEIIFKFSVSLFSDQFWTPCCRGVEQHISEVLRISVLILRLIDLKFEDIFKKTGIFFNEMIDYCQKNMQLNGIFCAFTLSSSKWFIRNGIPFLNTLNNNKCFEKEKYF